MVICENDEIACPACNKKFSITTITRHIEIDPTKKSKKGGGEKITNKDRDAINDICEKQRKRRKNERNALRIRRKVQCENDEIACPACNKKFSITTITRHINRASLAVSPKMEATQMEIFNFLWLIWDH